MADLEKRLSSWRRYAGAAEHPSPVSRVTDRVADHHRQQLARCALLTMENLAAHDQFCHHIEAYVKDRENERSIDHHQRVTDYAGYLLQVYENASARSLEDAILSVRHGLPREVEVVRIVRTPLPPQRSWLHRFLIG
jgi:hypothetical protein